MEAKARIYHLDAVRCFCMLFGLLVHGSTIGNGWAFEAIKQVSDHFRMPAFFVVSGYFTAMVASRQPIGGFLRNRGKLVLIPLVSGLILLNPITTWLIQLFHFHRLGLPGIGLVEWFSGGWRAPTPGKIVWHLHLWFLFSLFTYALITPALLAIARRQMFRQFVDRALDVMGRMAPFILALAFGMAVTLLRALHDQLVSPWTPDPVGFLVQVTMGHLPYFVLGLVGFTQRRLFETLHTVFWPGLFIFAAAYAGHGLLGDLLPRAAERAWLWIVRSGFIFLIVCGMLAIARRLVTKGSPLLSMLTDSVYSFYIFHFLVIYLIANLMAFITGNLGITFAAILLIGYPLLFYIHHKVIAPSPILTLLFNGKTRPAEPAAAKS